MNLSFFIARKYFLSKKKKNFINIISLISMLVVGISTMSLVIVLSVFNGLEELLRSTYGSFDPEVVVQPATGKSFPFSEDLEQNIKKIEGIKSIIEVIELKALIRYQNAERVVTLKGVSEEFLGEGRLENSVVFGTPKLQDDEINYAIVGRGVQYDLSINPGNDFLPMQVYYPRDLSPSNVNPGSMFKVDYLIPSSIFAIEKFYDENYVFVPLRFAENMVDYGDRRSYLELELDGLSGPNTVKADLKQVLGENFLIRSGDELHDDLYKILRIEKLFVFIIFSLIISIASVNIYFSLTMLAIDKKKDIAILSSLGATHGLIGRIFMAEGAIVALSGAIVGLLLGLTVSFLQQEFGFVSMGMQTTIMDAYPVKVLWKDVLLTTLCISLITMIASVAPARLAVKKLSLTEL